MSTLQWSSSYGLLLNFSNFGEPSNPTAECQDNNNCLCDLSLSNDNGDNAVTIGVAENIEAAVSIANVGTEPAYNAKLIVKSNQTMLSPRSRSCTLSSDNQNLQV